MNIKKDKNEKREIERDTTNSELGPAGINFRNPVPNSATRELIWISFPILKYAPQQMETLCAD